MPTYLMETLENYDPTWVTQIDDPFGVLPAVHGLQNKVNVGVRFDPVRRVLMYSVGIFDTDTQVNPTGFVLWDGLGKIAVGGNYDARSQFTQWIAEKNIDTGVVTFFQCYDSANLVPVGIGPTAVGEYRFTTNPANGEDIVLNGVTWTFVTAGAGANQTNIQADTLTTVQQLSWDLNASVDPLLSPAYYTSGYRNPIGTVCLGITYRLGGVAGNAYTLAVGSYGGTVSGAHLTGGAASSDGTWRRMVEARSNGNGSDPMMVDPRTGNVWQHTDSGALSCAIYLFRLGDDFSQVISPYQPPPGQSSHMELVGISDDWTYVRFEQGNQTSVYTITLTPRDIAADETTLDAIVLYAEFPYDPLWNTYYFRCVFNHSTSMFTYGGEKIGARAFTLHQFEEPSAAPFGGPTVGGGFTDITPWGPATGPNSNVAAYVLNDSIGDPQSYGVNKYQLYYLPVTDELVCINLLWAGDTVAGWTDPTATRFDCTYVDIAGGTFDYHEGFVTGYMQADWTSTTDPMLAAWVVLNVREMDLYLGQNTYDFSGLGTDYTKRWFAVGVQPVVAGAWAFNAATYYTIFVQYQFVSGAPPALIQIVEEAPWDAAYASYGVDIGNANVVYKSLGDIALQDQIGDSGISDGDTFIFASDGVGADLCFLTPAYLANRQALINANTVTGPFLRLSISTPALPVGEWFALMGPARPRS